MTTANHAAEVAKIVLTPVEVEQLAALCRAGLTWPGDLVLKSAEKSLRAKGLACRVDGWCTTTADGDCWLRCSGLGAAGERG